MSINNLSLNNIPKAYSPSLRSNIQAGMPVEKNFNEAKGKTVYMKTDDMLFSGGNGTGLSFYLKYAEESTEENPIVVAKGIDEKGTEFEKKIYVNDINPTYATIIEMRALEAHNDVDKKGGFTSLPNEAGSMGANDRKNFISMFEQTISELKKLGRYDLSLFYMKTLDTYLGIGAHSND